MCIFREWWNLRTYTSIRRLYHIHISLRHIYVHLYRNGDTYDGFLESKLPANVIMKVVIVVDFTATDERAFSVYHFYQNTVSVMPTAIVYDEIHTFNHCAQERYDNGSYSTRMHFVKWILPLETCSKELAMYVHWGKYNDFVCFLWKMILLIGLHDDLLSTMIMPWYGKIIILSGSSWERDRGIYIVQPGFDCRPKSFLPWRTVFVLF